MKCWPTWPQARLAFIDIRPNVLLYSNIALRELIKTLNVRFGQAINWYTSMLLVSQSKIRDTHSITISGHLKGKDWGGRMARRCHSNMKHFWERD